MMPIGDVTRWRSASTSSAVDALRYGLTLRTVRSPTVTPSVSGVVGEERDERLMIDAAIDAEPDLVPELLVSDIRASLEFWCGVCGFDVAYERPDERFACITRGTAQVMLEERGVGRNWVTGELAQPFGRGINLQISVPQIDSILSALAKAGLPLFMEPETRWYRVGDGEEAEVRQFLVTDPDGYLIRFQSSVGRRGVGLGDVHRTHRADPTSISLSGRVFAGVSNAETGQVSSATRFRYHEDGTSIWAEYEGGEIVRGFLVGTRNGDRLAFRYAHLAADGATADGVCDSRIRVLADGRVRLEESWSWESRPGSGASVVEEIG